MSASMLDRIHQYGQKVNMIGLFFFDVNSQGYITPAIDHLNDAMTRAKLVSESWPHITCLLTVKNDGFESIFRAILENDEAQNRFISEIHRILDEYPWCDGIDIDLEHGPNDLEDEIYSLFSRIYNQIKSRENNRHVHIDLPPMTGPHQTVGPEKWCDYSRLVHLCDTAQIMTYGFAWAGSAPGSTTPVQWMRNVLNYATSEFNGDQLYTGVPAYGHRWQIYDYPSNLDALGNRRGTAGGFSPFLRWMLGDLSHTDQYRTGTETQQYIPFASYYDSQDFHHLMYLHVYDYLNPDDRDHRESPMVQGTYDGKPYVTCFQKQQKTAFVGQQVNRTGTDYVELTGAIDEYEQSNMISPRQPGEFENESYARYEFTVPEGRYDIAVRVNFPWWDQQRLELAVDGEQFIVGDKEQWYPYHRRTHWLKLGSFQLSDGTHTFELFGEGSQYGTQFYGFRVCQEFRDEYYGGEVEYTVRPRKFLDVNRDEAWPHENHFKATLETLRRDPEHVHVWYDDFRDWNAGSLPSHIYRTVAGAWEVSGNDIDDGAESRPYKQINGSGEFRINYESFSDLSVQGRVRLNSAGAAGVVFGDLWLRINTTNNRLELVQNGTQIDSYSVNLTQGSFYTIRMRVRNQHVACFLGTSKAIDVEIHNDVNPTSFGMKSTVSMTTDLLIGADSYWFYPQEALEITLPDGTTEMIGRIPRSNVLWDDHWDFFRLDASEEPDTREEPDDGMSRTIQMDWDYLHSKDFDLLDPGDYSIRVKTKDTGVWLSTVYLGDKDGFSIVYFPDAETINKLANVVAYDYRINGIGMWTIGQEDPSLWELLPDQV